MPRKPTPKIVSEVCSLCGLDWSLHGENPTTETCIELLLDEARSLNARLAHHPIPHPPLIPWYPRPIQPYPWGWRPYSTTYCQSSVAGSATTGNMPTMSNSTPRPVVV